MDRLKAIIEARETLTGDIEQFYAVLDDHLVSSLSHFNDSPDAIARAAVGPQKAQHRQEVAFEALASLADLLKLFYEQTRPLTIEETKIAALLAECCKWKVEEMATDIKSAAEAGQGPDGDYDEERRIDERERARDINAVMRGFV